MWEEPVTRDDVKRALNIAVSYMSTLSSHICQVTGDERERWKEAPTHLDAELNPLDEGVLDGTVTLVRALEVRFSEKEPQAVKFAISILSALREELSTISLDRSLGGILGFSWSCNEKFVEHVVAALTAGAVVRAKKQKKK